VGSPGFQYAEELTARGQMTMGGRVGPHEYGLRSGHFNNGLNAAEAKE
jgi:hypothetical protein